MPSLLHEGIVALVRERPALAAELPEQQGVDLGGGNVWTPYVVGPDGIPVITDVDRAAREPHLAVLSAMAHGKGDVDTAVAVASAAFSAVSTLSNLDDPMRVLYLLLIESSLGDAARKAFEMLPETIRQFYTETHWKIFAEGEASGEAKGEARGEAKAVLRVLERRGLPVSDEQRARVLACSELSTLETWLDRAVTAASTDELFV